MNPVQQSKGTPVTVLLSHDARIDARRGNQLLASFYLNAGAQTLDTRSFPDGSYTVNTHVMDIWTPAGMLAMNLTDDVTISGSLYDDWHIAPGNP